MMPRDRDERRLYLTILLGYWLVAVLFARFTPAWQAPDEPAHFNYIRQLAQDGCCPRIEPGDWSSATLAQLTSGKFAPELLGTLDSIQYEDHHPPLYYALATPLYHLGAGNLQVLRLLSVCLGAGVVMLSYAISRRVLPQSPQIALAVMAFLAFLPQHVHMMSAVNNDALSELLAGLCLLWLLRAIQGEPVASWHLGTLVGLALLTKVTVAYVGLLAALVIGLRWRRSGAARSQLLRELGHYALAVCLVAGGWWLRNSAVYGFPDILGLAAHDRVVLGQPRSADYIAAHGLGGYLQGMLVTSFKSFWGQFGWMALPLDGVLGGWVYRGFALLTGMGLAGALLAWRGRRIQPAAWLLLGAALLVLLQFTYYNLQFQQWQGRYLYPALVAIALLLCWGVDYWRSRWLGRWDWSRWLLPLAMLGLAALDIYLLFRVILPGLSP